MKLLAVLLVLLSEGTARPIIPTDLLEQTTHPIVAPRMKAIVYRNYGSDEVLRVEELDKPVPSEDQVLIKVHAASVNPLDWHFMRGTPYIVRIVQTGLLRPSTARLGTDVAGDVEAVGRSVTQFKPGDEVFGCRFGAFAEYVCAKEQSLVLKPVNVTFEEAAAVPIAALTALQGLRDKGHLKPGQTVLINGASGGVGTFAVQIAKALGAEVTGVCSTKNVDMVRSIGADHVIDYTQQDFTANGKQYDLILDMIGNHSLSERRRALTPKGTLVLVGSNDTGLWLGPHVGVLKTIVYSWFVSQDIAGLLADINKDDLTIVRDLLEAGKVKPVIDRRYRLSQVPDAIRYLEDGHARGKVVITLEQNDVDVPVRADPAAGSMGSIVPELTVLAFSAIVIGLPIVVALALNRRFQRRNPQKRPYRWGCYFGVQALIGGIVLGLMLESGTRVTMICCVTYSVLAWFFVRRRHWAWITLTILSFNPVIWIINGVYLRKRWEEHVATAPAK
jgi:NADPH:quinone reductase-like Zn-dependent oxidoreductase